MPVMKITVDAAMRARDVSRPSIEHDSSARAGQADPAETAEDSAGARRRGLRQPPAFARGKRSRQPPGDGG